MINIDKYQRFHNKLNSLDTSAIWSSFANRLKKQAIAIADILSFSLTKEKLFQYIG